MKPAILFATALVIGATQTSNQSSAGTWTAEHAGQTFVRLELQVTGKAVAGRLSLGDVELDKTGQVKAAKAATREPKPIFDVAERGGNLTFAHKDGNDTDRFEFRLIDATTAELALVITDEMRKEMTSQGISDVKPFKLTKLVRN